MEAPWSVMGYLLVLQPLALGRSVEEVDFKWSPFWIQVHGIPVAKLTRQNGEIIGRRIGNHIGVEALHDGFLLERSFLRIRVEADVSKPLPRGFILQHHGSKDKESWVSYKYEKLSDFCYDCGRLGHDNSSCKFVSHEEGKNSGYGPELRTSRAPRLDTPAKQIRQWVDEAEERVRNLVNQRPGATSTDDACKMTHTRQSDITEPVATASSADPEVATDSAEADPPRHAPPLRTNMLSASGKGCGRGGQPVQANEVFLESTVPQLTKRDHFREGIVSPMEFAPSKLLMPSAQSSVGLRLGPQYFVTEPVDHNLLIKATHSHESRVRPFNEIGIEEVSPNSSPTQVSFVGQTIDKCMASFFKDLSIKRKASEDLVNTP
ncbi:hypothetical protein ACSBR2_027162 [Camellia fascicularis]